MSDKLKWLLLIPAIILAIALAYFIPKLIGGSDNSSSAASTQQNQAMEIDKAAIQERIDTYAKLVASNPADADSLRGIADNYRELGALQDKNNQLNESAVSYKTAVDYYRKYLAIVPSGVEAKIDMGLTYFYLQMPEIAERALKESTHADPKNQRAWHALGWVEKNGMGNSEQARIAWQTSINIDPESPIGQESKSFLDQLSSPDSQLPTQSGP
ncbi:MAG: tetratricopeptide repeat protein [Thermoleophilia bacterium]